MKVEDIDKVRGLLWKVEDRTKLLKLLQTTRSIHVTVNRGHRDDEHMHFGGLNDGACNRYDLDQINTHLATIVEAEILVYKAELIGLGVELDE